MKAQKSQQTEAIINAIKLYDDFPKPGLKFLDVFQLLSKPKLMNDAIDIFENYLKNVDFDKLFMLQCRGFLFAVPLSLRMNKPCYPFRKKGKLPGQTARVKYSLEYGSDEIEIQKSAVQKGDKIVIVDDVLATGGTLNAAISLLEQQGATVEAIVLVNVVANLNGLDKLKVPKEKVFYIYDI